MSEPLKRIAVEWVTYIEVDENGDNDWETTLYELCCFYPDQMSDAESKAITACQQSPLGCAHLRFETRDEFGDWDYDPRETLEFVSGDYET